MLRDRNYIGKHGETKRMRVRDIKWFLSCCETVVKYRNMGKLGEDDGKIERKKERKMGGNK